MWGPPCSFGDLSGWRPVFIPHQHMVLVLKALKHPGGRWRTSLLYKYERQDTVLEGPGAKGSPPGADGGFPWDGLRGRDNGRSSLRVADRRGLAAHRAAAAGGAAAAGAAAAGAAATAAPAAAASAAAARAAAARASAAAGLAAAHLTAVLVLDAAGEAVPRAAPHGPGGSGRTAATRAEFPRSGRHRLHRSFYIPSARVLAQGTDICFVVIYASFRRTSH